MDPIKQSFNGSKKEIMDAFPAALAKLNMPQWGRSDRLGLISMKQKDEPFLYAHIVERSESSTDVFISPGISYLKDRGSTKRPDSKIERIMETLKAELNKKG